MHWSFLESDVLFVIQIQHLLMLNIKKEAIVCRYCGIQIQHLLMLNVLQAITQNKGGNSNTTLVNVKFYGIAKNK